MSDSLIKALEKATTHRGAKKKRKASKKRRRTTKRRAKKTPKTKIRFRTRTVVKRVYVRKAAKKRRAAPKRRTTKKRRAKKSKGPLSRTAFLRRMALGRARAKRARKH